MAKTKLFKIEFRTGTNAWEEIINDVHSFQYDPVSRKVVFYKHFLFMKCIPYRKPVACYWCVSKVREISSILE